MQDNANNEEFEKRRQTELEKRKALMDSIYEQTERLSKQQSENRNEEYEKLKRQLLTANPTLDEVKRLVAIFKQPYIPHFTYEKPYYKEMFRLNKWPDDEHKKYHKPREVAQWTCRLIYGRFSKEVFSELQRLNPFIGFCVRRDKFFQYLNKEGQDLLDRYIDECITMMQAYDDWGKFEKDYCIKYGLYYQERLF
jgi:P63C domain